MSLTFSEDGVVRMGSRVRVRDEDGEEEFAVVAHIEADAIADRVSVESPLGRALLGRRVGERSLIAMGRMADVALERAVTHLVGQSRAFVLLVESALREMSSLQDERAERLMESMRMTVREPAGPGTLRHVEMAATDLLRRLMARKRDG